MAAGLHEFALAQQDLFDGADALALQIMHGALAKSSETGRSRLHSLLGLKPRSSCAVVCKDAAVVQTFCA
jgi:hypothetical protein